MEDYIQAQEISVDDTNLCKTNRKLPPIVWLQVDNWTRNNNILFVFAFLSLLTSRRVFYISKFVFLLVEHTHEDKNKTYGRLSSILM
jgi:hypothetical protein